MVTAENVRQQLCCDFRRNWGFRLRSRLDMLKLDPCVVCAVLCGGRGMCVVTADYVRQQLC